ncbi:hypothetical protein D3C81_1002730 [compost metagenome]
MEQEGQADQRDDDEFFGQLVRQVFHGPVDQGRAVVGGHDLHAGRQALLQCGKPGLDRLDGFQRVLARAHHDDAAGNLALAVELGNAAPHFGTELDDGDIAEPHRDAGLAGHQRDLPEVVECLQVPAGADHVLRFSQLQHRAAGFLVGPLERRQHPGLRQVVGAQPIRPQHDLVLLHHAAQRGNLGNVGQRFQLEAQEPVLQRAQLAQVMLPGLVHQRVLVDPADAGGVRPQCRPGGGGQAGLHLVQVFQHPRPCPVEVGAIVEQHVDKGVAKE